MKNKTILLGIALAIFVTLFTSCQKEDITPTEEIKTINLSGKNDLGIISHKELTLVSFPINVSSTTCASGGYTLTVTSPEVDLSNGNFTINWYKNTEQIIFSVGQTLECICGFGVRIEVLDQTETLMAEDSFDIPGC